MDFLRRRQATRASDQRKELSIIFQFSQAFLARLNVPKGEQYLADCLSLYIYN